MPIGSRLNDLIRLRGRNVNELAQQVGLSPSTIYSIIRRDNHKADPDTLRRLAEALDAPVTYFYEEDFSASAQKGPFRPDAAPPELRSPDPFLPKGLLRLSRKKVPILGNVAAGQPIYATEEFEDTLDCDVPCDFALRVAGDSMEPLIRRGDIVFVRRQSDVRDGQIAVVLIDDEATLKRVYHLSSGVQLVSINPNYAPMLFNQTNSDAVRILGRAVAYRRAL